MHTGDFEVLTAAGGDFVLSRVRAPGFLLPGGRFGAAPHELADIDILVRDGRIAGLAPAGALLADVPVVDRDRGIALPRLVEIHTHLDKGHIWARRPNPDGTHLGARTNVAEDRARNWNAEDVMRRMDFSLRCAWAHGTHAVRTHIDSLAPQAAISWPVLSEIRARWAGRIDVQGVALYPIDLALTDEPQFRALVETVARHGGVLGGNTFMGTLPDARSRAAIEKAFEAASAHGLDLDFHVDETHLPEARSLRQIAEIALDTKFGGHIVAGHCCSLALAPDDEAQAIVEKVAEARIAVVTLPMCNMYLQDRQPARTPRWRGVTPAHELAAGGVRVMFSSDNTRDPFYAYGDLDGVEVIREATRILQLDHRDTDWLHAISTTPADVMGLQNSGAFAIGAPADFILLGARTFNEMNSRPQSNRIVIAAGRPIDATPPDYRELDDLNGFQA